MYKNKRFPYLEDGQAAPRISDWQKRLSKSSEEVMSVLSDAMKKIEVKEQTDSWNVLHASLLQERKALLTVLADTAAQIPIPKGFFVGDAERTPAYRAICRLLGILEAHVQKLQLLGFDLSEKLAWLAKQKRNTDRVELSLWEVRCAADHFSQERVITATEALRTALMQERSNAKRLLTAVHHAEQNLTTLRSTTLPDFCNRMYVAADMEHDGAACNPAAAVRLCGELRAVLEALSF